MFRPPNTYYDPVTGRLWAPFEVRYTHGGVVFSIPLMATSQTHAEAILEDLKCTGHVAGETVATEAA